MSDERERKEGYFLLCPLRRCSPARFIPSARGRERDQRFNLYPMARWSRPSGAASTAAGEVFSAGRAFFGEHRTEHSREL